MWTPSGCPNPKMSPKAARRFLNRNKIKIVRARQSHYSNALTHRAYFAEKVLEEEKKK